MSRMIYDRRNNVTIEETITCFAEKIEKIGPEHHVLHQCIYCVNRGNYIGTSEDALGESLGSHGRFGKDEKTGCTGVSLGLQ